MNFHFDGSKITKVILVDDDDLSNLVNKHVIVYTLGEIPIEYFNTVDGALVYLSEHDKQGEFLIFLDLNMPVRDGFDFLDAYSGFSIKSKIVILSASENPSELGRIADYPDVVDFVPKPLTYEYIRSQFNFIVG